MKRIRLPDQWGVCYRNRYVDRELHPTFKEAKKALVWSTTDQIVRIERWAVVPDKGRKPK